MFWYLDHVYLFYEDGVSATFLFVSQHPNLLLFWKKKKPILLYTNVLFLLEKSV